MSQKRSEQFWHLGGRFRGLAGWGYAVKTVAGLAGFGLTAGAVQSWWAGMPLLFVRLPLALGGGGLAVIFAAWIFNRWRNAPALPGPFHEDLRQISRHLETFTDTLYQLYYTFADQRGYDERVWWKAIEGDRDAHLQEFAEAVYVGNGNTSADDFHRRSNITGSVTLDDFEGFHRARSEISSFLSRWYPRLQRDSRAREQALERLSRSTTARTFTALEALEDALSEALANDVRDDAGWREVIEIVRREAGYGRG